MAPLTFQNFIFFLGSGRPQTRFSSNVVFIFQKFLNVRKDISQPCRDSPRGPVEKEMCHLKAEKNNLSFWMFSESMFYLLMLYVFSFYSITPRCPYYVCSNHIMIIFCGWTSSCFFIGQNIVIVSFAIRNKAALRTLMQIYLAIYTYMAQHIFFLARFARSVYKTSINNKMYCTIRHKHKSIHHIVY